MKNISFHVKNFQKNSSVIFAGKIRTFLEFLEWNMGYLERNSETWKTRGFSGFECRVLGIGQVSIFGFGLGLGSKKVGLFPRVSGFRVQRPITRHEWHRICWNWSCLKGSSTVTTTFWLKVSQRFHLTFNGTKKFTFSFGFKIFFLWALLCAAKAAAA